MYVKQAGSAHHHEHSDEAGWVSWYQNLSSPRCLAATLSSFHLSDEQKDRADDLEKVTQQDILKVMVKE